jgi:predicted dienelactone hydrolase
MGEYCTSDHKGPECDLAEIVDIDFSDAGNNYKDERIKAVFAMAPALGPGMTAEGLNQIDIPVAIVAAKDDDLITPAYHAEHYTRHIPDAQLTLIPKGGHFVFVTTCTFIPTVVDFFITEIDMCGRNIELDRATVHADVANIAVEFFDNHLADAQ